MEWNGMGSDIIYQITYPRCQVRYVTQTDQRLITCFIETIEAMNLAECILVMEGEDIVIMASSNKIVTDLYRSYIGGIVC